MSDLCCLASIFYSSTDVQLEMLDPTNADQTWPGSTTLDGAQHVISVDSSQSAVCVSASSVDSNSEGTGAPSCLMLPAPLLSAAAERSPVSLHDRISEFSDLIRRAIFN